MNMWEVVLKILTVYLGTMIKFILGPVGGFAAGLNLVVTILTSVASMMTVVLVFSLFGDFIRQHIIRRFFNFKKYSDKTRKYDWIWRRYGLAGIALLTPVLLTPIGGTLLAISFGASRGKLILYMFVSAAAWSVILTLIIYFLGKEVLPDLVK